MHRFLDQAAAVEPTWGDSKQSDAQEFLRSLLDTLHTVHQRKSSPARRSLLPARSIDSLVCHSMHAASPGTIFLLPGCMRHGCMSLDASAMWKHV